MVDKIPVYERKVEAEPTSTPDFQGAFQANAESANSLSALGAKVAQSASNQMASQLGYEQGKNPHGDLSPSLTEFDKNFAESYHTQANATLSLQGQKLLDDAQVELSKPARLTPDLIDKTHTQLQLGLNRIAEMAPTAVKSHLQSTFSSQLLDQTSKFKEKMISQQREDQKNNLINALDLNTKNALELATNGDIVGANKIVQASKKMAANGSATTLLTPEQARVAHESAQQAAINGQTINGAMAALRANKLAEWEKNYAENKPAGLTNEQWITAGAAAKQQTNFIEGLKKQDESIQMAKFQTSVAMNPMSPDTAKQLQELQSSVAPADYEKAKLYYVNAIKQYNKEQGNLNEAIAGWKDSSSFARFTDKEKNKAFDTLVSRYMQQGQQNSRAISHDEAEVQVATSAGGRVPVFEKSLENKLLSGNPANIESAASQIDLLNNLEAGRVYAGISQKAKAIATQFQQQRGSMPDTDLARQITDNLSNIDDTTQKTLNNSWSLILSAKGAGGLGASKTLYNFALQEVEMDSRHNTKLGGDYFGVIYGNDIYNQLNSNFIATRGDYNAALKMTKDYVDQHYGDTYINGSRQISDSPIEKYLGYKGNDATPFIQKDLLNQLSTSFAKAKESHPSDYWETLPLKNNVAEVKRIVLTKDGKKEYRYPINLVGRAGNQWDVVAQTPYGQRNLFLVAPNVGVTTYQPDKEAIDKDYKTNKPKDEF